MVQQLWTCQNCWIYCNYITYGPRKAVAEVSKDKEPIGRECAEINWCQIQVK